MRRILTSLTVIALIALLVPAAEAAKKKKPAKGKNTNSQLSKPAQALLKQKSFSITGKVEDTGTLRYLSPTDKFGNTKVWAIDLPEKIGNVDISKLGGRKVTITFTGSAVARPDNQLKFMPKAFQAVKSADGQPLPKARGEGASGGCRQERSERSAQCTHPGRLDLDRLYTVRAKGTKGRGQRHTPRARGKRW
jgi:hypothetical protein